MDSNMSTAYVHRAGAGSSSGSSACTSSSTTPPGGTTGVVMSNGNPPGTGGGGAKMAVIGVTRNVKLRRRGASNFGFSLRGGREYGAGFYVSDVVPGGEAHRSGIRVGDQILRVNGYPVEDAVHSEVAQIAKTQQVLVLKIRSVGMIPVKDNPNDPVTWHMVQQQQQQLQFGDAVSNEIRIRIPVGEKGRLGCGVCRGIVPGLTVQGTREDGPARAAGLRAGDIILWCNGVSLTDLPFEKAIEVMRGTSVLDLVVNRPILVQSTAAAPTERAHYDCPENLWGPRGSSGYDSENSSLNQQPLSPHHQRSMTMHSSYNRNARNCCSSNGSVPSDWGHSEQEWMRKQNNTTVIRISQQNQPNHYGHPPYPQQTLCRRSHGPRPVRRGSTGNMYDDNTEEPIYDPVAPRDFECHDFDANPADEYRTQNGTRTDNQPTQQIENGQTKPVNGGSVVLGPRPADKKTVTTVEVHQASPPAPPSMPANNMPYKWPAESKPMNAMGMQMGSTMSMGSTGSTETESSLESSCGGKDCAASTSSSLSTSSNNSSTEQPQNPQSFATSIATAAANGAKDSTTATIKRQHGAGAAKAVPPPPPPPPIDLGSAISQELQRRAKQRMNNATSGQQQQQDPGKPEQQSRKQQPQNPEALKAQEQKVTHDKLMEEFKRAHQRMFSNAQQRCQDLGTEQNGEKRSPPLPATKPKPGSKAKNGHDDSVEMQSIESFKLKESPSVQHVPKPPSTYFPSSNPCTSGKAGAPPPNGTANGTVLSNGCKQNGQTVVVNGTSQSANDCNGLKQNGRSSSNPVVNATYNGVGAPKAVSKVAIRIGAYNEDKQPSRLGFLGQVEKTSSEGKPVVASRLRTELAATLQKSNLIKKNQGEINFSIDPTDTANQENGQAINGNSQSNNVEKLATTFNNKVTIRVNPETSSR